MTKKFFALVALATALTGCGGTEMWIPVSANQPAVRREQVRFLEQPPSEPYRVVGVITPPPGQYRTVAEAVKAMRRLAAKHGADAIYIESATEEGGWQATKRPFVGMSGRSTSELHIRAKAIVFEHQPVAGKTPDLIVKGVGVSGRYQCAHYDSDRDLLAIKFKCCGEFYACIECHEALADHRPALWPKSEHQTHALACGNCHGIFSIAQYLRATNRCPHCEAEFNPHCVRHHRFYFEI